jgi:hypothetical protein
MNTKTYLKALTRADAKGVAIVGYHRLERTFFVRGSTGKVYAVKVDMHRLTCNCFAGNEGIYCMHRAVIRRQIIALAMYPDQVVYPYLTNIEGAPKWAIEATKNSHRWEMEYIVTGIHKEYRSLEEQQEDDMQEIDWDEWNKENYPRQ